MASNLAIRFLGDRWEIKTGRYLMDVSMKNGMSDIADRADIPGW